MPQAPRILSKSQIFTLESCYLFLRTLRPLLASISGESVSPATRAQIDSTIQLAARRETELIFNFVEVASAADRWKLGGVR
jgi:hypothetical protein